MDFKGLAENLGLEEKEFLDLVKLFLESSATNVTDLEKAIAAGDSEGVIKASHSLKGAAGNLGFQDIYELSQGVETKARNNILAGSKEAIKAIKEKLTIIAQKV